MSGVKKINIFSRFINYVNLLRKYNTLRILYETDKRVSEARIRGYKGQCTKLKNKIKKIEGEMKND